MKKIIIVLILLNFTLSCSKKVNHITSETSKEIVELLDFQDIENEFKDAYGLMLSAEFPNLSEEDKKLALNEVKNEEMTNAIAKIYDENFSEDELQQILIFLKTEAGKKWIGNRMKINMQIQSERNKIYEKIDAKASQLSSGN